MSYDWFILVIAAIFTSVTMSSPVQFHAVQMQERIQTLAKRQQVLYAAREANIEFRCRISGNQERTFIWSARYERQLNRITVTGLQNIDAWTHIDVVTNDFVTGWVHRYARAYAPQCCLYTVIGTVVGVIHDTRIGMTLAAPQNHQAHGVKVTEACIQAVIEPECSTKIFVLHATLSDCQVTDVAVYYH